MALIAYRWKASGVYKDIFCLFVVASIHRAMMRYI